MRTNGSSGRDMVTRMNAIAAVERALRAVEERELEVRAWAWLDAGRAQAEAAAIERRGGGPLRGVVLGVKDVFDTWDQPTECGTPIFAGRRPSADAATVALLRAAGAVCLGKTATADLASFSPGPTTNPHRAAHARGGSSMGSAAAVACGMADVALGTQTAGSVTRPASFCGVFGFKPTFGTVSPAGVKLFAPSLDTVGWFARTPELLDAVRVCLTGRPPAAPLTGPPRIGVLRTEQWPPSGPEDPPAVPETAVRRPRRAPPRRRPRPRGGAVRRVRRAANPGGGRRGPPGPGRHRRPPIRPAVDPARAAHRRHSCDHRPDRAPGRRAAPRPHRTGR